MFITILALLITVVPFSILGYIDAIEKEKRGKRMKIRARTDKIKAIEARWPFISVPELYYYKRNTDPCFTEAFTEKTLHNLRIKHSREIKRSLKRK